MGIHLNSFRKGGPALPFNYCSFVRILDTSSSKSIVCQLEERRKTRLFAFRTAFEVIYDDDSGRIQTSSGANCVVFVRIHREPFSYCLDGHTTVWIDIQLVQYKLITILYDYCSSNDQRGSTMHRAYKLVRRKTQNYN